MRSIARLVDALRAAILIGSCTRRPDRRPVRDARAHAEDATAEPSYLRPRQVEVIASFFWPRRRFRAKPWNTAGYRTSSRSPSRRSAWRTPLSVIGQAGQSFGLILFSDTTGAYIDAAEAMEFGEEPAMPPHLVLNFERGAVLHAAPRKEIAEHRWEVADARAYPWLVAVDEDLVARPPTREEVTIVEAIALALPEVLEKKKALLAAWTGGKAVSRTVSVATHAGALEVSLRVPYERARSEYAPPYDVPAGLRELGQDGEGITPEERGPLEDELVRRFVASPEANALDDVQSCRFVMDFAADYFEATIATLGARNCARSSSRSSRAR